MGMGKQKFPIEDRIAQDGCADVGVRGEGGQILVGNPSVSPIPFSRLFEDVGIV